MVKETTQYESFVAGDVPILPEMEEVEVVPEWKKDTPIEKEDGVYHQVYMTFRNSEDWEEFQSLIGLPIQHNEKIAYWPREVSNSLTSFFDDSTNQEIEAVPLPNRKVNPPKKKKSARQAAEDYANPNHWEKHWHGMPEYEQENSTPAMKIRFKFRTEESYKEFQALIGQEMTDKTTTAWHPKLDRSENFKMRWIEE